MGGAGWEVVVWHWNPAGRCNVWELACGIVCLCFAGACFLAVHLLRACERLCCCQLASCWVCACTALAGCCVAPHVITSHALPAEEHHAPRMQCALAWMQVCSCARTAQRPAAHQRRPHLPPAQPQPGSAAPAAPLKGRPCRGPLRRTARPTRPAQPGGAAAPELHPFSR